MKEDFNLKWKCRRDVRGQAVTSNTLKVQTTELVALSIQENQSSMI